MTPIRTLLALIPVTCLLACSSVAAADPAAPASPAGDFRFQKVVAAGTKVSIHDMNGAVTFEPASGDTLEVVAVKTGRQSDLGRVQVVSREEGGTLFFCALWPGQEASTCREGGPRGSSHQDVEVNVEFRVRLPAKVAAVNVLTMNGLVRAKEVHGDVNLRTMNGLIDVDATGTIVAETSNGAVTAKAAAGKTVRLHTNNGKVALTLPAGAGADVDAATTNGRISSDFVDVPPPAMPALHAAKFKIGSGGTAISLHTTNGDVRVQRL